MPIRASDSVAAATNCVRSSDCPPSAYCDYPGYRRGSSTRKSIIAGAVSAGVLTIAAAFAGGFGDIDLPRRCHSAANADQGKRFGAGSSNTPTLHYSHTALLELLELLNSRISALLPSSIPPLAFFGSNDDGILLIYEVY
jgi:hypothetical protein